MKEHKRKYFVSAYKQGNFNDVKVVTSTSSSPYGSTTEFDYVSKMEYLPKVETWVAELDNDEKLCIYTLFKHAPDYVRCHYSEYKLLGWSEFEDDPNWDKHQVEMREWEYPSKVQNRKKETKLKKTEFISTEIIDYINSVGKYKDTYKIIGRDPWDDRSDIFDYKIRDIY